MLDQGIASPVYIKLHIGDPGASGTSNAASETTRKAITLGAASAGTRTGTGSQVQWTNYPAAETISWVSAWDDPSTGNFLGRHQLATAKTPAVGDTLTLNPTDVSFSVT
jgi:hypothetical protein